MPSAFTIHALGEAFDRAALWLEFDDITTGTNTDPNALATIALSTVADAQGLWAEWIDLLQHKGWTTLPDPPAAPGLRWSDFYYRGAVQCPPVPVFEQLEHADICSDPANGDVYVVHKGGIEGIDLPDPGPIGAPAKSLPVATLKGNRILLDEIRAATPNRNAAGTLGGCEMDETGKFWLAFYEFYNTAGRDDPGLVVVDGLGTRGAFRVGPTGDTTHFKNTFHQNVTQGWVMRLPGGMMGSGRRRPGNQAFGARNGPALYGWDPEKAANMNAGDDFGGDCLIAYPGTTFAPGFRYHSGDALCSATCIETKDGRTAVLFSWLKGYMTTAQAVALTNQYSPSRNNGPNFYGAPLGLNKGWHGYPYEPTGYLYDFDTVIGNHGKGRPWDVQPDEEFTFAELYRAPWNNGTPHDKQPALRMTWNPVTEELLGLELKSHDPRGGNAWRMGCVIHRWGLK